MYYGIGRCYIYKLIVKHYVESLGFNLDILTDECYSSMCNELNDLSDEELIYRLGKIYETSLKQNIRR